MHAIGGKSMPAVLLYSAGLGHDMYLSTPVCMHALFFVSKAAFGSKLKLCVSMFITQAEKLVNI